VTAPAEYEIVFQLRRSEDFGTDDGVEIGFGASGSWSSPDAAAYAVNALVQNGQWETEPGMPDPAEIIAAVHADEADQ
jgi:hypothetical protein